MNKNNDKFLKPLFIFQILILTLFFTTFFLQKGYFWAPLKVLAVPSCHRKRTAKIKHFLTMTFLTSKKKNLEKKHDVPKKEYSFKTKISKMEISKSKYPQICVKNLRYQT